MRVNEGYVYRERVSVEAAGRTVLSYLVERWPHSTAPEWRARIEAGRVLVDARAASLTCVLRRGQEIVWMRPGWSEPEAPLAFAILHRDDDLLVVAKPAGLPTLPGADFLEHTLLSLVRKHDPAASPVHRLGRFTSGLVLFARTRAAAAGLTREWNVSVVKRYRALASGSPAADELRIDAPIGPVPHPVLDTVHAASPTGKPSATRVAVLERRDGAFLCDAFLETGRPHQIRIHLAAAGHPLVGDPLYATGGVPIAGGRALPGDPGYLLHSAELVIRHPRTGAPRRFRCSPPEALRRSS